MEVTKLEKLLPDELEIIKSYAEKLLIEFGKLRITNVRYQISKKEILCPKCNSQNIVKNGHKNSTQRYWRKACNSFFSITTNSILNHSQLSYNQFIKLMECIIDVKTLEKTSSLLNISQRETYNLRIKAMDILFNVFDDYTLDEVVQADEKYVRVSFKGTRKDKMPRASRKSGSDDLTAGISKEQVCIIIAIDSSDRILAKIAGNGPVSTEMIEKTLGGRIKPGSILVTDSKQGYRKFAKNNKLKLKQIPAKKHIFNSKYNIAELNELMSELEIYLQNFRGLSTRHLQQYLDLFVYRKHLRYTIEYIKQSKELYLELIKGNSNLINDKICKTEMPIDVGSIYGVNFK